MTRRRMPEASASTPAEAAGTACRASISALWKGVVPLDMAAVGMIDLDILAREKGFTPMVMLWTLSNRPS